MTKRANINWAKFELPKSDIALFTEEEKLKTIKVLFKRRQYRKPDEKLTLHPIIHEIRLQATIWSFFGTRVPEELDPYISWEFVCVRDGDFSLIGLALSPQEIAFFEGFSNVVALTISGQHTLARHVFANVSEQFHIYQYSHGRQTGQRGSRVRV